MKPVPDSMAGICLKQVIGITSILTVAVCVRTGS